MGSVIKPTVGRVVLYFPRSEEFPDVYRVPGRPEPRFRADVCWVNDDGTVNLSGNDHGGGSFTRMYVTLRQEGEECQPGDAEWMPYQKAVASGAIAPTLHASGGFKEIDLHLDKGPAT